MKKIFLFMSFAIGIVLSCSKESDSQPENSKETKSNKVLIIGIDGCRPAGIVAANTPSLNKLMSNGTYSLDAQCLWTTSSGPGWSSMLTGVWQDKHGVTDNSFSGNKFSKYPHFFKRIEEADSENRTVSIVQWNPINDAIAMSVSDEVINASTDEEVEEKASYELENNNPTALFLQFSNVDFAGHGTGFSSTNPNYISAIEEVDNKIGRILKKLKARATYENENWIVVLSTDHGGLGTSHGGGSEEERTIFVIVSGDVVPNKEIKKETSEVTIAPAVNCFNSKTELYFEGDTFVEIPNNEAHRFGEHIDFSIECRIRAKIPGDVGIVSKKNWSNGTLSGYVFSFKPSTQKVKVNVGDGDNRVDVEAAIITDNEWHIVSATFDRDGLLKVYVDGVFSNASSMASIKNIDTELPFVIGADSNKNYKFKGYISEVRVFNTLLSENDIVLWKCKTLDNTHSKYKNLQGYWKLTEGNANVISDASSIAAHGVLTEGNWKNATIEHIEVQSNYDNTPRTVDVAATVLDHLCIPIKDIWKLESKSLIDSECSK